MTSMVVWHGFEIAQECKSNVIRTKNTINVPFFFFCIDHRPILLLHKL